MKLLLTAFDTPRLHLQISKLNYINQKILEPRFVEQSNELVEQIYKQHQLYSTEGIQKLIKYEERHSKQEVNPYKKEKQTTHHILSSRKRKERGRVQMLDSKHKAFHELFDQKGNKIQLLLPHEQIQKLLDYHKTFLYKESYEKLKKSVTKRTEIRTIYKQEIFK